MTRLRVRSWKILMGRSEQTVHASDGWSHRRRFRGNETFFRERFSTILNARCLFARKLFQLESRGLVGERSIEIHEKRLQRSAPRTLRADSILPRSLFGGVECADQFLQFFFLFLFCSFKRQVASAYTQVDTRAPMVVEKKKKNYNKCAIRFDYRFAKQFSYGELGQIVFVERLLAGGRRVQLRQPEVHVF